MHFIFSMCSHSEHARTSALVAMTTLPRRHSSGSSNTRRRCERTRAAGRKQNRNFQNHAQVVIADCQCVLGRVLARRGDLTGAEAAFRAAAEMGRAAQMPLVELIAGRELKQHVPAVSADGDAMIDAACSAMGKVRATFTGILAEQ